jgi:hypothetical protein
MNPIGGYCAVSGGVILIKMHAGPLVHLAAPQ